MFTPENLPERYKDKVVTNLPAPFENALAFGMCGNQAQLEQVEPTGWLQGVGMPAHMLMPYC